jgi:hypothetical protein
LISTTLRLAAVLCRAALRVALVIAALAPCALDAAPAIDAGGAHSVALKADGTLLTWGDDSAGQLGVGRTLGSTTPTRVSAISGVTAVAAGATHVIALKSDGTVWTWGDNSDGQLGDGTTTGRSSPGRVEGLAGVVAVAAGTGYSVALKSDGTVWTWGVNFRGQLGSDADGRSTPGIVEGVGNVPSSPMERCGRGARTTPASSATARPRSSIRAARLRSR